MNNAVAQSCSAAQQASIDFQEQPWTNTTTYSANFGTGPSAFTLSGTISDPTGDRVAGYPTTQTSGGQAGAMVLQVDRPDVSRETTVTFRFSVPVSGLSLTITDIDYFNVQGGAYNDQISVTAKNSSGSNVSPSVTGSTYVAVSGNRAYAGSNATNDTNCAAASAACNATFTFAQEISEITITYGNTTLTGWAYGNPPAQEIGLKFNTFCVQQPTPELNTAKSVQKVDPITGAPLNTAVQSGDTLEYTVVARNSGRANATSATLTDAIPAGTDYVPASTTLNGAAVADVAGAMPFATARAVQSPGAAAGVLEVDTTPSTLTSSANDPDDNEAVLKFRVRVRSGTTTISNTATLNTAQGSAPSPNVQTVVGARTLTLSKNWPNSTSGDAVTLSISGGGLASARTATSTAPAESSVSAAILVNQSVTVSELFTSGTASNYNTTLTCQKTLDNSVVYSGAVLTGSFTMPADSDVTCTFSNNLKLTSGNPPALDCPAGSTEYSLSQSNTATTNTALPLTWTAGATSKTFSFAGGMDVKLEFTDFASMSSGYPAMAVQSGNGQSLVAFHGAASQGQILHKFNLTVSQPILKLRLYMEDIDTATNFTDVVAVQSGTAIYSGNGVTINGTTITGKSTCSETQVGCNVTLDWGTQAANSTQTITYSAGKAGTQQAIGYDDIRMCVADPVVRVQKAFPQGRAANTDQVTLSATPAGGTAQSRVTAGTGTNVLTDPLVLTVKPQTGSAAPFPAITLAEAAAGGANSGNYDVVYSCVNNSTSAGATVIPSGSLPSFSFTPRLGDNITCTFSNTRKSQNLALSKLWGAGSPAGHTATATASIQAPDGSTRVGPTFNATSPNSATGAVLKVYVGDIVTLPAETFGSGATSAMYTTTINCTGGTPASSLSPGGTVTVTNSATATTCTYTNNPQPGSLSITKNITGGTSTTALTFPFSINCQDSAGTALAPYTGSVTVPAGSTTASTTLSNIPAGVKNCTITEGSLPAAPSGLKWGNPTYTVPSTALMPAGSLSFTIGNPLSVNPPVITLTKFVRNITTGTKFTDDVQDPGRATGLDRAGTRFPTAIEPSQKLEYCIAYTNTGGQALNFVITDHVPQNIIVSLPDGVRWSSTTTVAVGDGAPPANSVVLTAAADTDQASLTSSGGTFGQGTLTLRLATLPANSNGTVCFQGTVR
ncbi:hypothetical protein [Deinococcus enclensis]|uniref:Repeat protein (TIGR01451 family) n=1 Tax=Deinococcus enclensis TaxID=1049582 RepID=A0ABT9MFC3_9DEIO|nr:hypothetical protein [Deinococcus enclensis]MDP9765300.1 putative repeat protein (TIGR01451 family) [Deinococcus enclensis]